MVHRNIFVCVECTHRKQKTDIYENIRTMSPFMRIIPEVNVFFRVLGSRLMLLLQSARAGLDTGAVLVVAKVS